MEGLALVKKLTDLTRKKTLHQSLLSLPCSIAVLQSLSIVAVTLISRLMLALQLTASGHSGCHQKERAWAGSMTTQAKKVGVHKTEVAIRALSCSVQVSGTIHRVVVEKDTSLR